MEQTGVAQYLSDHRRTRRDHHPGDENRLSAGYPEKRSKKTESVETQGGRNDNRYRNAQAKPSHFADTQIQPDREHQKGQPELRKPLDGT